MCLVLTEKDIVSRYLKATKKDQQIRIMADLNDCSVKEIKDILIENGVYTPTAEIKKKSNTKKETLTENIVKSMNLDLQRNENMSKNAESKEIKLLLPGHVMAALTDKIDQLKEQEEEIQNKIAELQDKLHNTQDAQVEIEKFIEEFNSSQG